MLVESEGVLLYNKMIIYKKTYLGSFKYSEGDNIPCECCGGDAVDIHHILTRKRRRDLYNDINNLMAVCRECHDDYGDRNMYMSMLFKIHRKTMMINNIEVDDVWFDAIILKYED